MLAHTTFRIFVIRVQFNYDNILSNWQCRERKYVYKLDQIALHMGHEMVRFPPNHCQYNPIELIWTQVMCPKKQRFQISRYWKIDKQCFRCNYQRGLDKIRETLQQNPRWRFGKSRFEGWYVRANHYYPYRPWRQFDWWRRWRRRRLYLKLNVHIYKIFLYFLFSYCCKNIICIHNYAVLNFLGGRILWVSLLKNGVTIVAYFSLAVLYK